jgi:hypothetical protein
MAFCEQCGAQLSGTAKFCGSCGHSVGSAVSPGLSVPLQNNGRLPKILLGIAAAILLLGCAGAGVAYYLFHRMSAKAAEVTQGLPDLNSMIKQLPSEAQSSAAAPALSPDQSGGLDPNKIVTPEDGQCALFTKEELNQVLGTTFTHADADATGCNYKGDAPRELVRTEALWKGGRKLVKAKSDTYKTLRQSMVSQHYSQADIAAHVFPMAPYPGVGDEAWVNLWNVVTACKDDHGITMDLRYNHDSDEVTKMLTNVALSRLHDKKPDAAPKASASVP